MTNIDRSVLIAGRPRSHRAMEIIEEVYETIMARKDEKND